MSSDLIDIDPELLMRMDKPVPRYTSYPTAVQFQEISEEEYPWRLKNLPANEPLSLYIHIPFCKTMCLFCACSVVLNRDSKKQSDYLQSLLAEIDLVSSRFTEKRTVTQLHLGGGTPTSLTENEFQILMEKLRERFLFSEEAEISIEVDPRTVFLDNGQKLRFLYEHGFNRISFGVQDVSSDVQEAVRRRQSFEMTAKTYYWAREIGFTSINLDLIYGLPLQTLSSFSDTISKISALKPDRIALFSYAKVPWLKPHQKAIREEDLPSTLEKFRIYVRARREFMQAGYTAIGMDHFAKNDDSLAVAYAQKKLYRNFQGYSLKLAENMIGLGVSSIGFVNGCFVQNCKEIAEYKEKVAAGKLPVLRGKVLSDEDTLRRTVIQKLMCDFEIDKRGLGYDFDAHFAKEKAKLKEFYEQGLLQEDKTKLFATPIGKLFIRNIAAVFDAYLSESVGKGPFSKAI